MGGVFSLSPGRIRNRAAKINRAADGDFTRWIGFDDECGFMRWSRLSTSRWLSRLSRLSTSSTLRAASFVSTLALLRVGELHERLLCAAISALVHHMVDVSQSCRQTCSTVISVQSTIQSTPPPAQSAPQSTFFHSQPCKKLFLFYTVTS